MTDLSSDIAFCKELIDDSLPTNKGVTTPGKITTSLRGTNGIFIITSYFYIGSEEKKTSYCNFFESRSVS